MKKLLALALCMAMTAGMLAGCGNSVSTSDTNTSKSSESVASESGTSESSYNFDAGESEYPSADELEPHKIGVIWYGYTDQLSTSMKKNMDYLASEFNVELVYAEAYLAEDCISETENLIEAGCEGIMTLGLFAAMVEKCEEAGVYLAQFCNVVTDDEILGMIADSKYFAGMITESDVSGGEMMVEDLYERGCRNIVWLSLQAGASANHDNRVRGIEAEIEKYGDLNVLATYRGTDISEALTTFAVTYPEMDGILITGGDVEEYYQVMTSEGLSGNVVLATFDIGEGTGERLESGDLGWIAGGQAPTSGIAFSLLYNAITGNKILDDLTQPLYRNFLILQSVEDYDNYVKYLEGNIPAYTGDEIKALIKAFNPEADLALYEEYNTNYSIDDIVERHADLFQ